MKMLKGKDFILRIYKDGIFRIIACATSTTIQFSREVKEATKPAKSFWRSYYSGMMGYSVSTDALVVDSEDMAGAMDILQLMINGEPVQWMAKDDTNDKYFFTGYLLISDESFTSPAEGGHTFNFTAVGDGEISTNNPYITNFIQVPDNYFLTDAGQQFYIDRQTGGLPDYQ